MCALSSQRQGNLEQPPPYKKQPNSQVKLIYDWGAIRNGTKAFTNLGRLIKTEYILRYLTDHDLRRTVQLQLNKGEYRHKLPRWIFFANQGEFTTSDYEEIMNKASALSLVSNVILYWNISRMINIINGLRENCEMLVSYLKQNGLAKALREIDRIE